MATKIKKGRGLFLRQGLKEFKTNGSFFPSSKFLGKKILKNVEMRDCVCIIEIGAGTGAFTQQIIDILPENGRLILVEINSDLVNFLRGRFKDKRVTIILGDAKDLSAHLDKFSVGRIDYIISGIPLGTLSKSVRHGILLAVKEVLGQDGIYLQFQYFMASYAHIRRIFKTKIVGYEYRNLPPAFVYLCRNK